MIFLCLVVCARAAPANSAQPNFIVILADDLGYNDLSCFGSETINTHLDSAARKGVRFSNFYCTSPVCSAARASLLTGCYPERVGITGVAPNNGSLGINPSELLLPEVLKSNGYQTALFGKWHLGNNKAFMPLQKGFDEFLGTPHSNDVGPVMSPLARKLGLTGLPLYEGNEIITKNPN